MDREQISDLVHRLNDVELAVLLSLVAGQHCILTTERECLYLLQRQLELIGENIFGLTTTVVSCSPVTTLGEFTESLLVPDEQKKRSSSQLEILPISKTDSPDSYFVFRSPDYPSPTTIQGTSNGGRKIANIVIARDLDLANAQIQAQVLELMSSRRISGRGCEHVAPGRFLFIALLEKRDSRPELLVYLLDHFFISHHHSPEDGFPEEVEREAEENAVYQSDSDSLASVVIRKQSTTPPPIIRSAVLHGQALISGLVLDSLQAFAKDVVISTEIRRYIMDIVVFLRMHRAVASGVTSRATRDFEWLVQCLSPLHNLDFATPSLVSLAVFKVYNHRIGLVQNALGERSTLWGSNKKAVDEYLKHVDIENVVEEVLAGVRAPF